MKIALVHDQLQEFGGAERVLVALKKIYPNADVYTAFYDEKKLKGHASHFEDWKIYESFAARLPFFKKLYSPLRFMAPLIWESFDFTNYDLVISSSAWYMCKGIITRPETRHMSYIHTPPRFLYGYETMIQWQKYLPVRIYAALINQKLLMWDYISSQRIDDLIANSKETQKRISKFYRRESTVIYPPVDMPNNEPHYETTGGYYLTVSRLARAKHIDVLIEAANIHKFKLKIVGSGRDEKYLKSIAGDTVEFMHGVTDDELNELYKNAKAFLFASVDDEFGIAPIEAMGYGLPVIAYRSGGIKETVQDGLNGFLFDKLDKASLVKKIIDFELLSKEKLIEMKKNARVESKKYSFDEFKKNITQFVQEKSE